MIIAILSTFIVQSSPFADRKGSSPYWYGKETMDARGSELAVMAEARRRSVEGDGARGVAGAGSV